MQIRRGTCSTIFRTLKKLIAFALPSPQSSLPAIVRSLRHKRGHAKPEITSRTSATLPSIRIDSLKHRLQSRSLKLVVKPTDTATAVNSRRRTTRRIHIQHHRVSKRELWKVGQRIASTRITSAVTICHQVGDRGIVVHDEITPHLHERKTKVGAHVCWCWSGEVASHIGTVS